MTPRPLIRRALRLLAVGDAQAEPTPAELAHGLEALAALLARLAAGRGAAPPGLDLPLDLPAPAAEPLAIALAALLAPEFGVTPPGDLALRGRAAEAELSGLLGAPAGLSVSPLRDALGRI